MLIGLWLVSLAIAGLALAIMLALILIRRLTSWRSESREKERRRLIPLLLGEDTDDEIEPEIWRADDLVVELLIELIQLVRGSDRERFIDRAVALGVPKRLQHHLGSGAPRMRQMAAEALGYFDDEGSTIGLNAALNDSNPDVRLTAALSLAQSGRSPSVAELVDRLKIGTEERSLLITSLFKDLAEERQEELQALLGNRSAPSGARMAAAQALAHAGHYPAVPLISRTILQQDASPHDVPRLLRALAVLAHPAGAQAISFSLDSDFPRIRAAAAEAAGKIGLAELTPQLISLLDDPDWSVRFRAGEALAAQGAWGLGALEMVARHRDPSQAREAATLILAERSA